MNFTALRHRTFFKQNPAIALRTIDAPTQDYIAESIPETYVRHIEYSQATDTRTNSLLDFGYKLTESMKETKVPVIDAPFLGCLPNLEFFARVSGGRVLKCRIPIIK